MTRRLPPARARCVGRDARRRRLGSRHAAADARPLDEGLLLQAAARIADGQWPYGTSGWAYGPGQPCCSARSASCSGRPSVAWWLRPARGADAAIALLAFQLVRDQGAARRLGGRRGAVCGAHDGQPTTANPFPPPSRSGSRAVAPPSRGRPVCRRGCSSPSPAFWRPEFGIAALLAVVAATAADATLERRPGPAAAPGAATRSSRRRAPARACSCYAPFAVAAGPATLWDALVDLSSLRDGAAWRLPFPFLYDGPLRARAPAAATARTCSATSCPCSASSGSRAAAAVANAAAGRSPRRAACGGATVLGLGGLAISSAARTTCTSSRCSSRCAILAAGAGAAARPRPRRDPRRRTRPRRGSPALLNLASTGRCGRRRGSGCFLPGVPGILVAPEGGARAPGARARRAAARPARRADLRRPAALGPRDADRPLLHSSCGGRTCSADDAQVLNDPEERRRSSPRCAPPRRASSCAGPIRSPPARAERARAPQWRAHARRVPGRGVRVAGPSRRLRGADRGGRLPRWPRAPPSPSWRSPSRAGWRPPYPGRARRAAGGGDPARPDGRLTRRERCAGARAARGRAASAGPTRVAAPRLGRLKVAAAENARAAARCGACVAGEPEKVRRVDGARAGARRRTPTGRGRRGAPGRAGAGARALTLPPGAVTG